MAEFRGAQRSARAARDALARVAPLLAVSKQEEMWGTAVEVAVVSPRELAVWLDVSQQTLASWRITDRGPRWLKLGGGQGAPVRYVVADVLRWLGEQAGEAAGS